MSFKSIETILDRAMSDSEFAAQMLTNTRATLAEYDLSAEEVAQFESLSRADFDAFSQASPEERKSFGLAVLNHNQSALRVK
jgi:hypothetical protein